MAAPNLVSPTSVIGKSFELRSISAAANDMFAAVAANHQYDVELMVISNMHATTSSTVFVTLHDGANVTSIVKTLTLAPGQTLVVPAKIIPEGYKIQITPGTASVLDATCSLLDIS